MIAKENRRNVDKDPLFIQINENRDTSSNQSITHDTQLTEIRTDRQRIRNRQAGRKIKRDRHT